MTNTAGTRDAVQTVFVDLFCSLKSSMENPSLRVSGHDGSTSTIFIVEDDPEHENGQWATDEATVNKAPLMMKDRVFGHETTTSVVGSPESFRITKSKEEKVKEKVKAKVASKDLVRHTLVKNKLKTLSGGQEKIMFGGPRVKKERKLLRKVKTTFLKVNSVPIIQRTVQVINNTTRTQEEAKIRK